MGGKMQGVDVVLLSGYHRFVMSVTECTQTTVAVASWPPSCQMAVTSLNMAQLRAATLTIAN
jgi:hypothetical protein